MRVRRISLLVFLIFVFASCFSVLFAEEEKQGPIFAVTEENDLFSNPFTADHTDRHYTQGLKLTYLGGDDEMPRWAAKVADALPTVGITLDASQLGYVFGENMYTPENLLTRELITNDRPYAGWLYVGMFLQRRGVDGDARIPVLESFEIDLGVTGKPSLAEAAQENFHRVFFSYDTPKGWHNQLAAEPGLLLKYQRLWRLSLNEQTARYVDFIPHVGGDLGNVAIFANLGATLRVGYNLPQDFGVQINDSPASANGGMTPHSAPFGFYVFGGVDGRRCGAQSVPRRQLVSQQRERRAHALGGGPDLRWSHSDHPAFRGELHACHPHARVCRATRTPTSSARSPRRQSFGFSALSKLIRWVRIERRRGVCPCRYPHRVGMRRQHPPAPIQTHRPRHSQWPATHAYCGPGATTTVSAWLPHWVD